MNENITETAAGTVATGLPATMPFGWAVLGWGLVLLLAIVWFMARRRAGQLQARLAEADIEAATTASRLEELDAARDALAFEREKAAGLEKEQAVLKTRLDERERALAELKARFENDFQAIASRTIGSAHETFLQQAKETFQKYQEKVNADASLRHKAVDDLIKPMKDTLTRYEAGLREMRDHQKKAQGALTGQIQTLAQSSAQIQAEAAKLATALKSGARTRGKWGEHQLRNVVEMTGMSQYVDFEEQKSVRDETNSLKQPDMVVRLPGERIIAVDAKVSLNAYLEAVEQTDDAQRQVWLAKHADEIWSHVKGLSAKDYAGALRKENALDFVVMFIPGEHFYGAAMEAKPSLFQDAFDRGILIATPTTLIAILKSIAYGWRQEKAAENAHKVAGMAQELYGALQKMGGNLAGLGKSLEATVKKYNQTIGNIEGNVMPKARRFSEYEMPGTEEKLVALEPLETDIREVRQDRDLILTRPEKEQRALPLAE